jgi:hypothetical protein
MIAGSVASLAAPASASATGALFALPQQKKKKKRSPVERVRRSIAMGAWILEKEGRFNDERRLRGRDRRWIKAANAMIDAYLEGGRVAKWAQARVNHEGEIDEDAGSRKTFAPPRSPSPLSSSFSWSHITNAFVGRSVGILGNFFTVNYSYAKCHGI